MRMTPLIVGLDLGTAHLGCVIAGAAIPLRVHHAETLDVDKYDPKGTAAMLRREVDALPSPDGLPPEVVVEFGALYIPKDASQQQARAVAENHALMALLLDRLCAEMPGPVYRVTTIARQSWAHRVVPHHAGGVGNAEAKAGLAAWLDPDGAWPLLRDQHTVDAAGACVGYLLGQPKRESRPGKPGRKRNRKRVPWVVKPHTLKRRAEDAAYDALLEEATGRMAEHAAASPIAYSGRR